ncbi:MAG: alpha-glucuronidase, partial [Lachnospiraceae bacterium]|nr:alpha-glucuronidase [Lachnospiraceae bacterium]
SIYADVSDSLMENSVKELKAALTAMSQNEIESIRLTLKEEMKEEAYHLFEKSGQISIEASDSKGILYGTFDLLRRIRMQASVKNLDITKEPVMPLRMLNHWDNMDGSIERGYSGNSFFFENDEILINDRTVTYARLIASVGINGVVINNVNVKECATWLITDRYLDRLREMAEIFAGYGIKLYLSLNYAAPIELEELDSADPLSGEVKAWWKKRMKIVYDAVPNLGGFLIKADSEGRPGPFTYGRTHADGANMLAEAVEPYGGLIIWRCFVYNCKQDWRDRKTDRARAGYDNFIDLDGQFKGNVILQIKNGPMDFQVREPVHPLFGALEKTNQMLEVQIAQEYTGQQRHICYLIPMFKQILAFKTYVKKDRNTIADIVSGRTYSQKNCGMAAVANTGSDENWTGHDLAAANLYGFGRLAFEPDLSAEKIAKEWIRLTYGSDKETEETLLFMLMSSWPAYEKYTSPLGIGWMVNPGYHYGPNVDGYEYDRWGTYHRADHLGIGVDRSREGTGYSLLYREPNASVYDNKETCPDELLLFFHHVPYTWRLKSGKTVIQHIYDTHFEGVEIVDEMARRFEKLHGKLPEKVYERIRIRLDHQKEHAREWRDQINTYFYRKTGIPDEKKRKIY